MAVPLVVLWVASKVGRLVALMVVMTVELTADGMAELTVVN